MQRHSTQPVSARAWIAVGAVTTLAIMAPACAASFKSLMQNMGETSKAAKATIAAYDQARADQILATFASDSRAAATLSIGGGGAKAQDFHARFLHLAATAEGGRRSATDRTGFRAAVVAVASECRSCHSAYK